MGLGEGALPLASGGGGKEDSNEKVDMPSFDFFFPLNFPNLSKLCEAPKPLTHSDVHELTNGNRCICGIPHNAIF